MRTVLYTSVLVGLVVAVAALAALVGRHRSSARVSLEVDQLFRDTHKSVGPEQLRSRWADLPEPVRRYLQYAIAADAPAITTARLAHDGFMRTSPTSRWFPVDGEEYFTVAAPGFVWNGRMRPAPLVWIEARDRLWRDRGEMLVKLSSLVTLADARGPAIDQGSQLRWLAENVWFPYGFAGDDVVWNAIDGRSARLTLERSGRRVSAVVEIDDEGQLTAIRADRYRDVGGGRAVLTPWFGRCSDYRSFGGFRVPAYVEIGWLPPEGEFLAFRFRVTALEYNVAKRF